MKGVARDDAPEPAGDGAGPPQLHPPNPTLVSPAIPVSAAHGIWSAKDNRFYTPGIVRELNPVDSVFAPPPTRNADEGVVAAGMLRLGRQQGKLGCTSLPTAPPEVLVRLTIPIADLALIRTMPMNQLTIASVAEASAANFRANLIDFHRGA